MHLKLLLYTALLWLVGSSPQLSAQNQLYDVIWLNSEEKKLAGQLSIDMIPNISQSEFNLSFTIHWFDANGNLITDDAIKPLIYLSDSDIQIVQNTHVYCKTFTDSDAFDIYFSDIKALTFGFLPDVSETVEIRFLFKYAYSQEDIFNAKTYVLGYSGGSQFIYRIPLSRLKPQNTNARPEESEFTSDPRVVQECLRMDSCVADLNQRSNSLINAIQLSGFQARITSLDNMISSPTGLDSATVARYKEELNSGLESSGRFLPKLDTLARDISQAEKTLTDPIPYDSIRVYRSSLENISRKLRDSKDDLLVWRAQMRTLLSNIGVQVIPNDLSEQREIISNKFRPLFNSQVEKIQRLLRQHEVLMEDLQPILTDLPSKAIGSRALDSLIIFHTIHLDSLESFKNTHRTDYLEYIGRIKETGAIAELETLHSSFNDSYTIATEDLTRVSDQIDLFKRRVLEIQSKEDYTLLWIGGSVMILLIFVFLIREIRINRKRNSRTSEKAVGSKLGGVEFDLDEELKGPGYYPFIVPQNIESVIKELHLSNRAIKSINQIVQGAISNKSAHAFGGFLFGTQYKTQGQGQGAGMYMVMVDQVIVSKTLHKDFTPGVTTNEDIVDEIDRVISENKTKTLLGWFTSTDDEEFMMSESLIKVHRTFFRDRWQIAMLINPFSSDLRSAVYLRRKSGYFEPKAEKECQISLDELYQYSIDPPTPGEKEEEFVPDMKEFKQLVINGNWCDSIVLTVNFHLDVISSIKKETETERIGISNNPAVGSFYGKVIVVKSEKGGQEYHIYITRYVEVSNGEAPRDIPGYSLLGWLSLNNQEIFESLKIALPYHDIHFKKPFQVAVVVNTGTAEMRVFSQKHNLEMNNNIIETEEFNLSNLITE